jgi:hypothetical protein
MKNYQIISHNIYKIAAIAVVAFGIQLQTGCNLAKTNDSASNAGANQANANNSQTASGGETAANQTPATCRNAYYPVGANVERKYQVKYQKMANLNQDYTETYSNFTDNEFTSKAAFKEVTSNVNWRCLPEGLIATQYGNSVDLKNGAGAKIDTLKSSGISYPSESRWNTGEKWTTDYDIKETIKNPDGKSGDVVADGKVNQNGEILGAEEVTVPAGKFQTMKVKVKTVLDLKVNVSGMTVPTKTNVETTSWFAKDVGMVKSISTISGLDSGTVELLSYSGTK